MIVAAAWARRNPVVLEWLRDHGLDPMDVHAVDVLVDDAGVHLELFERDESGQRFVRGGEVATRPVVVQPRRSFPAP